MASEKDKYEVSFTLEVDPAVGASDYEVKSFLESLSRFLLPDRFRIREVRASRQYDDSE
jgi:hypothetical protein